MIRPVPFLASLLLAAPLLAQQTTATIDMQQAVARCQEGVQAAARLRAKWEAPMAAVEKRATEINAERETLNRESQRRHGVWPFRHAMSSKEKAKLSHEIDVKAASVSRERARLRASVEEEDRKIIGDIASRMIPLLLGYAKDHGYSLVLDSGQQNGPVVIALNDITSDIIGLFDRATPAAPGIN